jgi:uncharacterized membrane protein
MLLDYAHARYENAGRRSRLAVTGWLLGLLTMPSCALLGASRFTWFEGNLPVAMTPPVLALTCCVTALIRIDRAAVPLRGRDLAIFGAAISVVSIFLTVAAKVLIELAGD